MSPTYVVVKVRLLFKFCLAYFTLWSCSLRSPKPEYVLPCSLHSWTPPDLWLRTDIRQNLSVLLPQVLTSLHSWRGQWRYFRHRLDWERPKHQQSFGAEILSRIVPWFVNRQSKFPIRRVSKLNLDTAIVHINYRMSLIRIIRRR